MLAAVLKPTVTLVTPSFNQGPFLERTIRSVLAQDYEAVEYIIVDGGSTDNSAQVIERYADRLAWWTTFPGSNQVEALKSGFARASGSLLGWINSDDVLFPGAISAAVNAFCRDPELLLAYGDNVLLDEHDRELGLLPAREFDVV